jgi:hypothetical protein
VRGGPSFAWFSEDTGTKHVWASIEPPGLQVGGLLELETIVRWREVLLERTAMLPVRDD